MSSFRLIDLGLKCGHVVFVGQDYLVNILLETATKEHFEEARYGASAVQRVP